MSYVLNIHLVPRAKRNEITGRHGAAVKIRLQAPPVDGKANQALLKFLAAALNLHPGNLTIAGGLTARNKHVRIDGLTAAEIWRRLGLPPARGKT